MTTEGTRLINVSVPGKTSNQVEQLVGATAQAYGSARCC